MAVDGPTIDSWTVEQVEVFTGFRRVELMAEEHARLNDLWGRGGLREIEEAIRPWRGTLSIAVRLGLRSTMAYVGSVPAVDVAVDGPGAVAPTEVRRTNLYGYCDQGPLGCPLVGGLVEASFDAAAIGETTRSIRVLWNAVQMAQVTIDVARLE